MRALSIPVITAGGVCDGRSMAAALMLGAEGVYMGTRFFMTKECPAGEEIKKALAENYGELDTYIGLHPYKNDTRFVLNSLMKEVAALEAAGEPFEKVAPLWPATAPASSRRGARTLTRAPSASERTLVSFGTCRA